MLEWHWLFICRRIYVSVISNISFTMGISVENLEKKLLVPINPNSWNERMVILKWTCHAESSRAVSDFHKVLIESVGIKRAEEGWTAGKNDFGLVLAKCSNWREIESTTEIVSQWKRLIDLYSLNKSSRNKNSWTLWSTIQQQTLPWF